MKNLPIYIHINQSMLNMQNHLLYFSVMCFGPQEFPPGAAAIITQKHSFLFQIKAIIPANAMVTSAASAVWATGAWNYDIR
jgi:hypothetical protein